MGADKNSIKEIGLFHSCTSASFSCQVHVATGVLLNLGSKTQPTASTHTQRKHTRHGCWQPKPVRPVSETGQTASIGLSLTQAGETGQTVYVQELPKDPKHLKSLSTSEQTKPWSNRDFLAQKTFSTAHRAKPVRPVWETGQAGFCLDSREEHSPREKLNTPSNRSLGIDGVPRGLPLARSSVPKNHSIKRNQKSTLKSTSNPRNPKPPKSSPLAHGFGRGITAQRTMKGSHKFPPSNPQEQGPENAPRESPRKDSENHHQEQPGKTHPNLEEPRRIIYT
jgi:hypothetical protein